MNEKQHGHPESDLVDGIIFDRETQAALEVTRRRCLEELASARDARAGLLADVLAPDGQALDEIKAACLEEMGNGTDGRGSTARKKVVWMRFPALAAAACLAAFLVAGGVLFLPRERSSPQVADGGESELGDGARYVHVAGPARPQTPLIVRTADHQSGLRVLRGNDFADTTPPIGIAWTGGGGRVFLEGRDGLVEVVSN